jgi:3-hydroxyisobutyrate dehydrogenase-like beta-hydroxyacid dehydrogenase
MVGFIGIGKMGLPMANRIAVHGNLIYLWAENTTRPSAGRSSDGG